MTVLSVVKIAEEGEPEDPYIKLMEIRDYAEREPGCIMCKGEVENKGTKRSDM